MAFEGLDKFTEFLAREYSKKEDTNILIYLAVYQDCMSAKFKSQKLYVRNTIKKLNPSFYSGFFKKEA